MSKCLCGDRMTVQRGRGDWVCECGMIWVIYPTNVVDQFQRAFYNVGAAKVLTEGPTYGEFIEGTK